LSNGPVYNDKPYQIKTGYHFDNGEESFCLVAITPEDPERALFDESLTNSPEAKELREKYALI